MIDPKTQVKQSLYEHPYAGGEELKKIVLSHVAEIKDEFWRTVLGTLVELVEPEVFTDSHRKAILMVLKHKGLVDEDGAPTCKLIGVGMDVVLSDMVEDTGFLSPEDLDVVRHEIYSRS